MTIGIDLRAIVQSKYSGVEEYSINLLDALFKIDRDNKYLLFSSGQSMSNRYLEFSQKAKETSANIDLYHCSVPNRFLNASFKFFSWPKIDNLMGEADVIFEPNINILPVSKAKKVVTFHDLSFEKYRNFFSAKQIFWHNFINPKKLAKDADLIIAVSDSTKSDLNELYGIPEDKIRVIYSGVIKSQNDNRLNGNPPSQDNSKLKIIKDKYKLPDNYILYLGTIEPRKNIIGLIKAFEIFKKSQSPMAEKQMLVIAGSKGWLYEEIFRAAANSEAKESIIFTGFVEDEDKASLYEMSDLFVYPSFYEGFGFPPLEAMANGVPAIVSDCSSFPEVAGDSAIMINPYNTGMLAWAMREVLSNEEMRKKMIDKGYDQVKKFSWEKCARETLEVFEEIIKNKRLGLE